MRVHYYEFPETVDAHTRYIHGAQPFNGVGLCYDRDDEKVNDRSLGYCTEATFIINGISIKTAKNLLKQFGGRAWTCHYERDGTLFETSEITQTGNNSKIKYNRHL